MAKKKKSQLKPVERGFATTSVPKKPTVIDAELAPQTGDMSHKSARALDGDSSSKVDMTDSTVNAISSVPFDGSKYDAEKAEEQSLQNLVDRYQEKTEKEITRSIKV
jgi:ATP-dependent RNA helicase DHX29